ncbi:hypothetical protein D3C87_1458500 [compost metagenome]
MVDENCAYAVGLLERPRLHGDLVQRHLAAVDFEVLEPLHLFAGQHERFDLPIRYLTVLLPTCRDACPTRKFAHHDLVGGHFARIEEDRGRLEHFEHALHGQGSLALLHTAADDDELTVLEWTGECLHLFHAGINARHVVSAPAGCVKRSV